MIPVGAVLLGLCVGLAVAPIRFPRPLAVISWVLGAVAIEVPFLALALVAVSTLPAVLSGHLPAGGWPELALNLLASVGLALIIVRSLRAGSALHTAMDDGLGPGWRADIDPSRASRLRPHLPWLRIVMFPVPLRPHDVERTSNLAYGPRGKSNLLDVYRHRSRPANVPTLIHLHGGRFRWGRKSREARPLLHRLARQGWTCISANYQLSPTPAAGFPDHLVDAKRILAWARTEGRAHGIDPDTIILSGSSAGAHLTAMAALTAGDPRLQPGFEGTDTSVLAAIAFYGYFGELGGPEEPPSTPLAYLGPEAPPFLVIHGANDTMVPVASARALADGLRAAASAPVVMAELPGAQHSFDLSHSIRFESVVAAAEEFTAWVLSRRAGPTRPSLTSPGSRPPG